MALPHPTMYTPSLWKFLRSAKLKISVERNNLTQLYHKGTTITHSSSPSWEETKRRTLKAPTINHLLTTRQNFYWSLKNSSNCCCFCFCWFARPFSRSLKVNDTFSRTLLPKGRLRLRLSRQIGLSGHKFASLTGPRVAKLRSIIQLDHYVDTASGSFNMQMVPLWLQGQRRQPFYMRQSWSNVLGNP